MQEDTDLETINRHADDLNEEALDVLDYQHHMSYQDIFTIEPGKRGGQPCIRGMRITVYDVLDYLASGMTHEKILQDFPYLTKEDVLACLRYAEDENHENSH